MYRKKELNLELKKKHKNLILTNNFNQSINKSINRLIKNNLTFVNKQSTKSRKKRLIEEG